MCNPVAAAIIASGLIGGAVTKHQGDKQRALMEEQAAEAERLRKEQEAKFEFDKKKAEAVPILQRNAAQKTRGKGLQGMKISKTEGSGYSSVGMGSSGSGTGLNIPKG